MVQVTVVAGIGFIGGGAILKGSRDVRGTATAASIWTTGVLGAAVALDRWVLAATLAVLNLVALRLLLPWKMKLREHEGREPDASGRGGRGGSDRNT
jgi:putative Mg2+ transporter-C (MgtC) family protein